MPISSNNKLPAQMLKTQPSSALWLVASLLAASQTAAAFWLTDLNLMQQTPSQFLSELKLLPTTVQDNSKQASTGKTPDGPSYQQANSSASGQCRCNLDQNELENQINDALNKWLRSEASSQQLGSLLAASNSTGARRASGGLANIVGSGSAREKSDNNWTRRRQATILSRGRQPLSGLASQQQQQLHHSTTGLTGPKGEQGARGERGPSGLISVASREAMFDLAKTGQRQLDSPLVFIESEQLLALRTNTGWHPVAILSSPLSDMRLATGAKQARKVHHYATSSDAISDLATVKRLKNNSIEPAGLQSERPNSQLAASAPLTKQLEATQTRASEGANKNKNRNKDEDDDDDDFEDGDNDNDPDDPDDEQDDDDREDDEEDEDDDDDNENDVLIDDEYNFSLGGKRARPVPAVTAASGRTVIAARSSATEPRPSVAQSVPLDRRATLRLVALNEPFSGNIHGIRGADFECKRNAARANIKGSFRAFLASNVQNLNDLVRHGPASSPIVNIRGEILADSWHDLLRQPARVANPLSRLYSFDGRHVASDSNWPNKLVWHGASNRAGYRDPQHNCDSWHSDALSRLGLASPIHVPQRELAASGSRGARLRHRKREHGQPPLAAGSNATLSELAFLEVIEKYPCRMPLILLCIETIAQHSQAARGRTGIDGPLASNML